VYSDLEVMLSVTVTEKCSNLMQKQWDHWSRPSKYIIGTLLLNVLKKKCINDDVSVW